MINIAKQEFNADLDSYLDKKRSQRGFYDEIKKKLKKKDKEYARQSYPSTSKPFYSSYTSMFRKRIPSDEEIADKVNKMDLEKKEKATAREEVEAEVEEMDEEAYEERQEGIVKRVLVSLGLSRRMREDADEEEEVSGVNEINEREYLKDVIRTLHKWLEKLPPEQIRAFRNSEDFQKYKDALEKLGMIKK